VALPIGHVETMSLSVANTYYPPQARFDARATQTERTARSRPNLLHSSSYYSHSVPCRVGREISLDTAYLRQQIGGLSSVLMITFHESLHEMFNLL